MVKEAFYWFVGAVSVRFPIANGVDVISPLYWVPKDTTNNLTPG